MRTAAAVILSVALAGLTAAQADAAPRTIDTAVGVEGSPQLYDSSDALLAFRRIKAAGATFVRVQMSWSDIAPRSLPASFNARNPADPAYDWRGLDRRVELARKTGLEPVVSLMPPAPVWAERGNRGDRPAGTYRLDAASFGDFAAAAATRYDGHHHAGLSVRYWSAWNEPNLSLFLTPQLENGVPVAAVTYRAMLNAFATSVHAAAPGNRVIGGELAPFRDITGEVMAQNTDWGPLAFMRALFCLSESLQAVCHDPVALDIWSTHPYASGGPTHSAVLPNDVSIGNLSDMQAVLDAAVKAGNLKTTLPRVGFWASEFSWDSLPPDPHGVPMPLLTRWVAETIHRLWQQKVSVLTWLTIQDFPLATSLLQSGLYFWSSSFSAERPKPMLHAFKFPVVAYPRGGRIDVWGRTPGGRPALVVISEKIGGKTRLLGTARTNSVGIFQCACRGSTAAANSVRARLFASRVVSPWFSLTPEPDRPFDPFGGPTLEPPSPF